VDEDIDEEAFFGGGGKEALAIFPGEVSRAAESSPRMRLDLASMPDPRAFMLETALPATERGPLDRRALRRFAAICLMVGIKKGQAGGLS